jgi:hypothetical protein
MSPPQGVIITITAMVIICIKKIEEKGGEMIYQMVGDSSGKL